MLAIFISIIFIAAIIFVFYKKYKYINEQNELIKECSNSLEESLEGRYKVAENLINFSRDYIDDENRYVVKLVQAKLLPLNEKQFVEKEFVSELKRLLLVISDIPELSMDSNYGAYRVSLNKTENNIYEHIGDLNRLVEDYNGDISKFPANIVATLGNFKKIEGFESDFITK